MRLIYEKYKFYANGGVVFEEEFEKMPFGSFKNTQDSIKNVDKAVRDIADWTANQINMNGRAMTAAMFFSTLKHLQSR